MTPNGTYRTKYQFSFESDNGNIFLINIKKDGYTGTIINRPLGGSPILKRDTSDGGICGTSLEFYAECQVDNEYAELYTSSARTFLVTLEKKRGNNWDTMWSGFIVPELYSAPDIAPPYDVQVIATDGLGELKNYEFAAAGRVSLLTTIKNIMSNIGQTLANNDIVFCSLLEAPVESVGYSTFLSSVYVDLDYFTASNCYEALQAILQSINARMTFNDNLWYIIRENDMNLVSGMIRLYDGNGSQADVTPGQFGSMLTKDFWPVGQLTTEVIPAKNRVSAAWEFHARKSLYDNPDVVDSTGWTLTDSSSIRWENLDPSGNGQRPVIGDAMANDDPAMEQAITISQYPDNLNLSLGLKGYGGATKAHFQLRISGSGTTYYLSVNNDELVWSTTAYSFTVDLDNYGSSNMLSSYSTLTYEIPPMPIAGTLTFKIWSDHTDRNASHVGNIFRLGWVYLTQVAPAGLRCNVLISNGAREQGDELPVALGGDLNFYENEHKALYGIMSKYNGTVLTKFKTGRLAQRDSFLQLIAVDYALTTAQTRLRQTGTLNVPEFGNAIVGNLPLFYQDSGGLIYLLEQMSWHILDDEVEVSLVSRPDAASITVSALDVTEMLAPSNGNSSGSSGGSSGGSGVSDYDELTNRPRINNVTLTGNKTAAQLGLMPSGAIEFDGDTVRTEYPFELNINDDLEQSPVYRSVTDLLQKMYVTNGYVSVSASILPSSSGKDLGTQGNGFDDIFAARANVDEVNFHYGSQIYEPSGGRLRLKGNDGVELIDATNLSTLSYTGGVFSTTELDDLGDKDEPWGDVWAQAFYVDYDMVDGTPWPIGFRWDSQASHFELIGPTYFYGGEFLPMASYQGSAVTKTLGNMYFFWDYTFCRGIVMNRDSNDVNRGFFWDSNDEEINCNTDIDFTGNVYINGNPLTSSDERLKRNVVEVTDVEASKILTTLRSVGFDWTEMKRHGYGFIAQEVQKILPELVHRRTDGLLSMDYTSLIAFLVKGWQEQEKRIEALEKLVKSLIKDNNE